MNTEQLCHLKEQSFTYALQAIKLCQFLQEAKDPIGQFFGTQYLQLVTVMGTQIEGIELDITPTDLENNCTIACQAAKKSLYLLKLLSKANIVPSNRIKPIINTTEELIALIDQYHAQKKI